MTPNGLADPSRTGPGTRLQRFELYNWGTFDRVVWTFDVDGRNALLTGDIGSGKSTAVDALTTLLLPANRVSYNRAAGADSRERDLRSYVLGYYKSARVEETGATRPIALRDPQNYSVILGTFVDSDLQTTTTIAQVFRAREDNAQPERFYVVADEELTVAKHFSGFGTTLPELKRQLRGIGARLYDHFPEYGRDLQRRLHIPSDQALELFHQTVSMKSVDNLNDFVRSHMLEPFDMTARIGDLIEHFDNLTKAHEAVLRARDQLGLLDPLIADLDTHDSCLERIEHLDHLLASVRYLFAGRADERLAARQEELSVLIDEADESLRQLAVRQQELNERRDELVADIARAGGERISKLEAEIDELNRRWPSCQQRLAEHNHALSGVGLDEISTREQFDASRTKLTSARQQTSANARATDEQRLSQRQQLQIVDDEIEGVNRELKSLDGRRSNLPSASLDIRASLISDLGLNEATLPFAGELIEVDADATEWEGAAERVLRPLALALLVPDEAYQRVARWINERHLGARLVYHRVPTRVAPRRSPDRTANFPTLVDLLHVQSESRYAEWVHAELARAADYHCVDSTDDFRRVDRAVTRQGQIKSRNRHEKDDRSRLDDRRNFVLGWSNERKIEALVDHATRLSGQRRPLYDEVVRLDREAKHLIEVGERLAVLVSKDDWDAFDWQRLVARINEAEVEVREIRDSSDLLRTLTDEKQSIDDRLHQLGVEADAVRDDRGKHKGLLERIEVDRASLLTLVEPSTDRMLAEQHFDALVAELTASGAPGIGDTERAETSARDHLTGLRDRASTDVQTAINRVIRQMNDFRNRYPAEVAELDSSVESGREYRELHQRVAQDDLPRFEAEFKRSLNENTIQEIAGLSAELNKQDRTIRDRIATINSSLEAIDYNPERYIRLVASATPNAEIRDFREQLRICTSNIVGSDDEQYSEQRFLDVKSIIDRFKGREGSTDIDRRWTRRVTDVRQWSTFTASERWRSDDSEHESYSDSDGKSGGQKEKLAYTILASSLAYQYQLDPTEANASGFRFVVIDEAFGRGSDESTRYALGLFARLGLQVLVVTPLTKIRVIEPFVHCLGYVDNLNDNYSRLQRVTIDELREQRKAHDRAQV